jgi:hypothetical protein
MRRRTQSTALIGVLCVAVVLTGCADAPLSPNADGVSLASNRVRPGLVIVATPDVDTVRSGETVQLSASGYDRRGRRILPSTITWVSSDTLIASITRAGVMTARDRAGSVTITAVAGSVTGTRAMTVVTIAPPSDTTPPPPPGDTTPPPPPGDTTPPPPSPDETWTFCTDLGAVCTFIGLRDVRLIGPTGKYVVKRAFGSIPCAPYGFDNQNPEPHQPLRCEYGRIKTTTIANPMPGMGGLGATVTVALGAPGFAGTQSRSSGSAPYFTDGSGSFRTTCSLATYRFDDPLVYPGRAGASHLHAFFGNVSVNESSTPATLLASGNSTCRGGILNRSSYWTPALVDSRTGEVQTPGEGVFYYKTGYNMDPATIRPMPAGLRMIAGDMRATGIQWYIADWGCRDRYVSNDGMIQSCPVGDAVRLAIHFPQCWDGVNLDSPDHKSHMSYPDYRNAPSRSTCPSTHPVPLPQITEIVDYDVRAGANPLLWRLASDMYSASTRGGLSAHADWMNGWDSATMATLVTHCLNKALDCGVGMIGNGLELF